MLIDEIEAYLRETGMSASAFGRVFAGTPNFVGRLRGGGTTMESTAMEIRGRMREALAKHREQARRAAGGRSRGVRASVS
jgi:hypothetical protein